MNERWAEDFNSENRVQLTADLQRVWETAFVIHFRDVRTRLGPEKGALVAGVAADETRAACHAELARRNDDSQ